MSVPFGLTIPRAATRTQLEIDFAVDVPDETKGKQVARLAADRGDTTKADFDKEHRRWTCYCTKRMVATYAAVIAVQKELDALSAPGW